MNINSELTKKNINIYNKDNENNLINNSQKEKKMINNCSHIEDFANFDGKEDFNTLSARTKIYENTKKKLEINKITNSNIITNRTSPKVPRKNRIKKFINNKNRNSNKNTCFGKSVGINNNIFLSKDYSIKSEQRHFNNVQEKLFISKKEQSASTKNINHFDESKLTTFIKKMKINQL